MFAAVLVGGLSSSACAVLGYSSRLSPLDGEGWQRAAPARSFPGLCLSSWPDHGDLVFRCNEASLFATPLLGSFQGLVGVAPFIFFLPLSTEPPDKLRVQLEACSAGQTESPPLPIVLALVDETRHKPIESVERQVANRDRLRCVEIEYVFDLDGALTEFSLVFERQWLMCDVPQLAYKQMAGWWYCPLILPQSGEPKVN